MEACDFVNILLMQPYSHGYVKQKWGCGHLPEGQCCLDSIPMPQDLL